LRARLRPRPRPLRRPPPRRGPLSSPAPLGARGAGQIAGLLGAPGIGIAAAQKIDDIISGVDSPLLTAAVAPVFLGTAAAKGILSAGAAVVDFFGGSRAPIIGSNNTPAEAARRAALARKALGAEEY
jgi:hypothetical protein